MLNSKNQLRTIGVNSEQFNHILIALQKEIDKDLEIHSMKRRGVKTKKGITIEIQLLLTLTYLRHYPTFLNLGNMFNISESYANKIYHKTTNHLIKFIHAKSDKKLSLEDVKTVIVDVAEQQIERPVKKQKSYYSGKKNAIL